jgi:branched-chain amino acid transport system substrate-binding protein
MKGDKGKRISRRDFLAVSSAAAAGGVVGGLVAGGLAGYFVGQSVAGPARTETVTRTTTVGGVTVTTTAVQTQTVTRTVGGLEDAPRKIKIGATVSETGILTASVGLLGKAYKAAERLINQAGGIYVEEYGRRLPVEIIYYDDKSDPATTERFYTRLATEDQVDIMIGPFTAVNAIPASAIAERFGVPHIDGAAAEKPIFNKKWVVGCLDLVEKWLTAYFEMVDWYKENKRYKIETVAFANSDEPFGNEVTDYGIKLAEARGISVVGVEKYTFDTTDFTPIITKFKAVDPDVIIMTDPVGILQAVFWKQAFELGLRPRDFHPAFGLLKAVRDAMGPQLSDGITSDDWVPPELPYESDLGKRFYEKVQAAAGYKHDEYPWQTIHYVCLEIALKAVQVAGSLDKEKIRDALYRMRITTIGGVWQAARPPDEFAGRGTILPVPIQYIGGVKRVLWPPELATGEWVYPAPWAR